MHTHSLVIFSPLSESLAFQAQQLESMETEIQNMQMELANVHRERQQLEQQKKLLKCTGPCAPCSCSLPPGMPQVSGSTHQGLLIPCVTGASVASMSPMTEGASLSGAMVVQTSSITKKKTSSYQLPINVENLHYSI